VQTILVVDDELGPSKSSQTSLEDEGYRVLSAANGRHGLEKLAEGQVDLAVIDFMMPLLDGAPSSRHEGRSGIAQHSIIMMSAVGESMVRERFDGYTAFLRKPFRIAALIETVQRVLARAGDIVRMWMLVAGLAGRSGMCCCGRPRPHGGDFVMRNFKFESGATPA